MFSTDNFNKGLIKIIELKSPNLPAYIAPRNQKTETHLSGTDEVGPVLFGKHCGVTQ